MLFDIFIFLIPLVIGLIVYGLSFRFTYNKIWSYISFTASFIFIFSAALSQTNHNDVLSIRNEIEEIVSTYSDDSIYENEIANRLLEKHSNPIVDYKYSKVNNGTENIIKVQYKEKLFNGIILLQNRLYIKQ